MNREMTAPNETNHHSGPTNAVPPFRGAGTAFGEAKASHYMRRCIQTAAGGQTHDSTFEATDTT